MEDNNNNIKKSRVANKAEVSTSPAQTIAPEPELSPIKKYGLQAKFGPVELNSPHYQFAALSLL